jgi:hypothetical protein
MEELKELIYLIDLDRLKSGNHWQAWFEPDSKLEQLCLAVHQGRVNTDEEAAEYLYGSSKMVNKYYNVKKRLKERLTLIVAFMGVKKRDAPGRLACLKECMQNLSLCMALMSKKTPLTAIGMLENLLKQTLRYEFTDLSLNITSTLRVYYGTAEGNIAKHRQYNDLHRQLRADWQWEDDAERFFSELTVLQFDAKSMRQSILQNARNALHQLQAGLEVCNTFRFQLCARLIELQATQDNPEQMIRCCEATIEYLKTKPFDVKDALHTFYYHLITCHMRAKALDKVRILLDEYNFEFEEGTPVWFRLQEQAFLLAMRSKEYADALEIYQKVDTLAKQGTTFNTELWKIYEAYIQYLAGFNLIEGIKSTDIPAYRQTRLLNNTPVYSKDKRGMNISILIIQILFGLQKRDFGSIIDRIESIKKYCSRYLKNDANFRSNCFIRMLLMIPEGAFHQAAVSRRVEGLYKQLIAGPPASDDTTLTDPEIIPYEYLWDIILESLPTRRFDVEKTQKKRDEWVVG